MRRKYFRKHEKSLPEPLPVEIRMYEDWEQDRNCYAYRNEDEEDEDNYEDEEE